MIIGFYSRGMQSPLTLLILSLVTFAGCWVRYKAEETCGMAQMALFVQVIGVGLEGGKVLRTKSRINEL